MRSSKLARCALANALLRHRNQNQSDTSDPCPVDPEHQAALLSLEIEDLSIVRVQSSQHKVQSGMQTDSSAQSAANGQGCSENTEAGVDAISIFKPSSVHSRNPGLWRLELNTHHQNSPILAALRPKLKTNVDNNLTIPDVGRSDRDATRRQSRQDDERAVCTTPRVQVHHQETTPDTSNQMPRITMGLNGRSQFAAEPDIQALSPSFTDPRDSKSPTSDTTLLDDTEVYSLTQPHDSRALNCQGPCSSCKETTSISKHKGRYQRTTSVDSATSTAHTPSIPLRARVRIHDGMLPLMANPSEYSSEAILVKRGHRRAFSLNMKLPVNIIPFKKGGPEHFDPSTRVDSYARGNFFASLSSPLSNKERELEYIHRHTFIGTASLDDLLEILETSQAHSTTKTAVARAFIQLSSSEQLHARQYSTRSDGWELVSRISLDVSISDYVGQLQVKLGSITLRHFLDLVPFGEKDEIESVYVIEAFVAASHMDAKADKETSSRARAFRSWVLEQ